MVGRLQGALHSAHADAVDVADRRKVIAKKQLIRRFGVLHQSAPISITKIGYPKQLGNGLLDLTAISAVWDCNPKYVN